MNRLLLLLCCICVPWMARGQAAYEWLYWFDMNHASRVSGLSIGDRFTITTDVKGLSEGFHTIHVQVADTAGKYSPPLARLFYYTSDHAIKHLHYWFDNEVFLAHSVPVPLDNLSIDVSGLEPGLHFIYCQAEDAAGTRSEVICRAFYRQTVKSALKWTYWFDEDEESLVTMPFPEEMTMIDVSHLQDGFHVLHNQVFDVAASDVTTTMFIKVPQIENAGDMTCICSVDNEIVAKETLPASGGIIKWDMDVDSMDIGIHKAMFQVITPSGAASSIAERYFIRTITNEEMGNMKCVYSIDDNQTFSEAGMLSNGLFHFDLDVSSIESGLHRIAYMLVSEEGMTLPQQTAFFWKAPQNDGKDDMTCICTVDGKLMAKETLPALGGIINWNLDVDKMDVGIHKATFQVITPSGAASMIEERYFVRTITNKELGSMKCVYSIDNFETYSEAGTLSDGLFHFNLDVASIENGLHRIAYTLVSETGVTLPQQTAFFWKTPLGGEGIVQYDYWINENDDQKHVVHLDQHTNPFSLITLLPVETQPIRSSNFQFAIKNGEPLIYARNDFHIQFFDTNGRMVEETKEYVDEQVSAAVEPVGELQVTQTFDKIAENDIRWYTMQAAPGDTVAFKLSQAATAQLFAPSGAEVFKTSESASTKWSGIHTWEDGTYYLAVHDVTGSQSTMKLEYMHMDKYDVVDWDVHRVGNGGCSTITFKGNGFRDLYAVDLVIAPGDTIHSVDVSHDSDAETAVTFDFTDAALGDYNAMFHFTEEDKPIAHVVTVEEAIDIELATEVSFPSSFGHVVTYTCKITNNGNMTAYAVPIYTWLKSKTLNGIYHIDYDGLDLAGLFDDIDTDSLTTEEISELKAYSAAAGDDHHFMKFRVEDPDRPGDSIYVRSNYFFTNIAPYETKTLRLTISTREVDAFAYFTVPEDWPSYETIQAANGSRSTRAIFRAQSMKDRYCCIQSKIECAGDVVAKVTDLASKIAGFFKLPQAAALSAASCIADIVHDGITVSGYMFCNGNNDVENRYWDGMKKIMDAISIPNTVANCVQRFLPKAKFAESCRNWSDFSKVFGLHDLITTAGSCFEAFTKPIPGCPPIPPGGGGAQGGRSHDPNEIYGYLSQAGSKFIADSVARVNYTIEFENDTMFATAAAHTIVIKDTLDSHYFDLTKFMPTGVRIGGHDVFLNEADIVTNNDKTTFVKTIDMRPEINAIAQVDGEFNQKNGIAQWTFQSLDPMTMEPTDDLMQGILPVNYDGTSGIGEVMFEIGVKSGKSDGTQLSNRAGIVFDYEEAILTPTWTNIVDAVAPSSVINDSWMVNDSTLRITADGFDARSGVWKYEWYVQAGENAPWWKEGETESASFDYHIYEGIDYGFCVLAVDSAGNVEQKVIQRERGFKTYGPDYEDNISPVLSSPEVEGPVYDLSGRKHDEPQENQINIIDKKKILFRRKGK